MFIKHVCTQYNTTELPHEMAARGRREIRKADGHGSALPKRLAAITKELNLSTYKYHTLGDYPSLIPWIGTTDNVSTQTVSFNTLYSCSYIDLFTQILT